MAGKYQAYPIYRNAESRWLDSIPEHWDREPLKYLVSIRITDGPHETPHFVEEGVPFLSAEAVKNNALDFNKKRGHITRELHEIYSKKCLPKTNDVFMVKSGNTTGALAIVETEEEFNIWSPLALIRANTRKVLPRFVFYSMQSKFFQRSVQLSWSQGTQPNIGMGVIENLQIATATLSEQNTIANFLDHETAKIDTLIDKQQQLIKLLKEKRQAVVSHTVTKGLNPGAAMKDSGVEWLGEVPEHWGKANIGQISTVKRGSGYQNIDMDIGDKDFAFMLRISDIHKIEPIKILKTHEVMRYTVEVGDILVAGTGATAGISMIVTEEAHGLVHSYNSIKIRISDKEIINKFVHYFICSEYISSTLDVSFSGSAQPFVDTEGLKKLNILLPEPSEQEKIVSYLDEALGKLNKIEFKATEAIMLMQERRTALISAAVTGKIDVRNWQPTQTEIPMEASA
jgi:type I restriction enzyme S subunit